jgi:CheY-like chemotaxis protein
MAKILIIDDDPDMVLATRMCLESGGHQVVEANSPEDGLKTLLAEAPDLLVLDVMMDTATAGFQTALTIRSTDADSKYARFRSIPIVMSTAIHTTTPLRFGPDSEFLPVDAFVDKPIDPDKFLKTVNDLLASRK